MTENVLNRNELFSAIETGTPRASYIKTILGQVAVTVWDNFLDKPADVILRGNPKSKDKDCIVSVYSDREKAFFERTNLRLFKKGLIIPYAVTEAPIIEKTVEQSTDEELKEIISAKFLSLTNKLNKIESVPVLFRMLALAEEMDKSTKITGAIQARISELQVAEYLPKDKVATEE